MPVAVLSGAIRFDKVCVMTPAILLMLIMGGLIASTVSFGGSDDDNDSAAAAEDDDPTPDDEPDPDADPDVGDDPDSDEGDDTVSAQGQRLTGDAGNDTLDGGDGDDTLEGLAGEDYLDGEGGDDILDGEAGDDWLFDTLGRDSLFGGAGDDTLIALDEELGAPDILDGGAEQDVLWGDDGDTLTGGSQADIFIVPISLEGGEPVTITDLDYSRSEENGGEPDRVVFVTPEGDIIPRDAFFDGTYLAGIGDAPDGSGAAFYVGSDIIAIFEGHSAEELFFDTIWIGNFSPELTGFYDGDDALTGTTSNEDLFGGAGSDTLTGLGGGDYLDGQDGDDLVIGVDAEGATSSGDTLVGNAGDDTLRGDAGDNLAGSEGSDSYELLAPEAGDASIIIHTYDLTGNDGAPEPITIVDEDGTPLSADEVLSVLTVTDTDEGAQILMGGEPLAIVRGVSADELDDPEDWLGNLFLDDTAMAAAPVPSVVPVPEPAPAEEEDTAGTAEEDDAASSDVETVDVLFAPAPPPSGPDVAVTSVSGTGQVVEDAFFGGNLVYSVNSVDGVPRDTYSESTDALDIDHIRYPAGQGDSGDNDVDGEGFLNILNMDQDEDGTWHLRPEVTETLDWARETGTMVTLVLPTKNYTVEEYRNRAGRITLFAEVAMRDYGDVIEAFEIGNEYWSMGETAYGQKANVAAVALNQGMENAGYSGDDQPAILVQMGTPNGGSEFHSSVDDRGYGVRVVDANRTIIDQLSGPARGAIDGVVEHYYFNKNVTAFTGASGEINYIDRDYAIWEEAFDKELDLYITEWNVRITDTSQTGLRSASVMLEMTANMMDLGVDAAHAWPVQHNTPTDLAGNRADEVVLDEEGRVVSSINGATFGLMSSSLVGLEAMDTELSVEDDSFTLHAYQSDDTTVVYVSSRSDAPLNFDLDLSELVASYDTASAVIIGADTSTNSSDGVHFVPGEGYSGAQSVLVDGQRYYINENDVRAELTDVPITGTTVPITLDPYEVIEITYHGSGSGSGGGAEPGGGGGSTATGELLRGTDAAEELTGGAGNDTIQGEGGADRLIGGRGSDQINGGDGNDTLNGWGGNDDLKGGNGNDRLFGDQGNDTLVGSRGNDALFGALGADVLNGLVGDDLITGGEGSDTVTGWAGDDTFVIRDGHLPGGDVITDFTPGEDLIEVDLSGVDSMSDMTFTARADGILIRFDGHGSVLLQGDLTIREVNDAGNFRFV